MRKLARRCRGREITPGSGVVLVALMGTSFLACLAGGWPAMAEHIPSSMAGVAGGPPTTIRILEVGKPSAEPRPRSLDAAAGGKEKEHVSAVNRQISHEEPSSDEDPAADPDVQAPGRPPVKEQVAGRGWLLGAKQTPGGSNPTATGRPVPRPRPAATSPTPPVSRAPAITQPSSPPWVGQPDRAPLLAQPSLAPRSAPAVPEPIETRGRPSLVPLEPGLERPRLPSMPLSPLSRVAERPRESVAQEAEVPRVERLPPGPPPGGASANRSARLPVELPPEEAPAPPRVEALEKPVGRSEALFHLTIDADRQAQSPVERLPQPDPAPPSEPPAVTAARPEPAREVQPPLVAQAHPKPASETEVRVVPPARPVPLPPPRSALAAEAATVPWGSPRVVPLPRPEAIRERQPEPSEPEGGAVVVSDDVLPDRNRPASPAEKNSTEQSLASVKPADSRPADSKPEAGKPVDAKPAQNVAQAGGEPKPDGQQSPGTQPALRLTMRFPPPAPGTASADKTSKPAARKPSGPERPAAPDPSKPTVIVARLGPSAVEGGGSTSGTIPEETPGAASEGESSESRPLRLSLKGLRQAEVPARGQRK